MRPATPKHRLHDSACPYCGEPFQAKRVFGVRMGQYDCGRCGQSFVLFRDSYRTTNGHPVAAWIGEPL